MDKLFKKSNDEMMPSIEGVVTMANARNYGFGTNFAKQLLDLRIDTFTKGSLTIYNAAYRINRGERVRLYSKDGFEGPSDALGNFYVHGVQILGIDNKPIFQSVHSPEFGFREVSPEQTKPFIPLHEVVEATESNYIRQVLKHAKDKGEAASILGITRKALWMKIKEYGIPTQ